MSILKNSIQVKEVMLGLKSLPVMDQKTLLKVALEEMSGARIGIACITDENFKLHHKSPGYVSM